MCTYGLYIPMCSMRCFCPAVCKGAGRITSPLPANPSSTCFQMQGLASSLQHAVYTSSTTTCKQPCVCY